jgi:hypothetical protein
MRPWSIGPNTSRWCAAIGAEGLPALRRIWLLIALGALLEGLFALLTGLGALFSIPLPGRHTPVLPVLGCLIALASAVSVLMQAAASMLRTTAEDGSQNQAPWLLYARILVLAAPAIMVAASSWDSFLGSSVWLLVSWVALPGLFPPLLVFLIWRMHSKRRPDPTFPGLI